MRSKGGLAFALTVCALTVHALTFHALAAHAQRIVGVGVEGNEFVSDREILDVIETRAGDDLSSPVTKWKYRNDLKSIYALGWFDNVTVTSQAAGDGVELIFLVDEKPKIVEFRYEGNERYKPRKLNKEIGYTGKERLFATPETAGRYKDQILAYYTKQSYPNTEIDWRFEDGPEPNTAVLVFEIREGERLPVREIVINGNEAISDAILRKRIQTRESWWFIIKNHFDPQEAERDLIRIQRTYWELGYLDAEARLEPVEEIEDGLRIVFTVEEGEPYTLGAVSVEGNTIFSDEELLSKISLRPGDRFLYQVMQEDELEMLNLYLAQGYLDTGVPAIPNQWEKDQKNHVVNFRIPIEESPRIHLGKVEIQGVVTLDGQTVVPTREGEFKTKDFVIRRELEVEEGEPLDWTQVAESDRNLVNTQLFRSRGFGQRGQLNLVPGFQRVETADPSVENLLLQLEETESGLLSFGGGLSTSFGPSVFANFTERNVFGYGVRGSVTGELGKYRNQARLSVFEPHLFDTDFSLDWDIYYVDTEGFAGRRFDEQRIGTQITVGQELGGSDELQLLYGIKVEETDLSPDDDGDLVESTVPEVFNLGSNMTTSLLFGFVHDTRDFKQDPSSGWYNRAIVELAGLTDNEFIKFQTENNYYQQLFDRFVLALSSDLRLGHAYGDPGFIPLQERYFVGGARSIRGFDEGSIGESAVILYESGGGFKTYLGGEASYVGSAEIRYPFTEIFQGVVFLDMGTVWPEIGDIDPTEFRFSTGAGIRVRIPGFNNALLRLDFAVPLRKEDGDETEFFHFGFSQAF